MLGYRLPDADSDFENLKKLIYPRTVAFPHTGGFEARGFLKNRIILVKFKISTREERAILESSKRVDFCFGGKSIKNISLY